MNKKEEIRQSLDLKYYKFQLYLLMIIYGAMAGFMFILFALNGLLGTGLVIAGILLLLYSPFLFYYLYRYFRVLRHPDAFEFYEAFLNEPHLSFYYRTNYFTVTFVDNSGRTVRADTKAIFGPGRVPLLPFFDDYFNQKVLIAYNSESEEVIVIKKIS